MRRPQRRALQGRETVEFFNRLPAVHPSFLGLDPQPAKHRPNKQPAGENEGSVFEMTIVSGADQCHGEVAVERGSGARRRRYVPEEPGQSVCYQPSEFFTYDQAARRLRRRHIAARPMRPTPRSASDVGSGAAIAVAVVCRTAGKPFTSEYHKSYVPGPTVTAEDPALVGAEFPGIRLFTVFPSTNRLIPSSFTNVSAVVAGYREYELEQCRARKARSAQLGRLHTSAITTAGSK